MGPLRSRYPPIFSLQSAKHTCSTRTRYPFLSNIPSATTEWIFRCAFGKQPKICTAPILAGVHATSTLCTVSQATRQSFPKSPRVNLRYTLRQFAISYGPGFVRRYECSRSPFARRKIADKLYFGSSLCRCFRYDRQPRWRRLQLKRGGH